MKKNIFLLISLFFGTNILSMDKDIMRSMDEKARQSRASFPWKYLPNDMKREILKAYLAALICENSFSTESKQLISDLKVVNRDFNNLIDNPDLVYMLTQQINSAHKYPVFLFGIARLVLSHESYKRFTDIFLAKPNPMDELMSLDHCLFDEPELKDLLNDLQNLLAKDLADLEKLKGSRGNILIKKKVSIQKLKILIEMFKNDVITSKAFRHFCENDLSEECINYMLEQESNQHKIVSLKTIYLDLGELTFFLSFTDIEEQLAIKDRLALLMDFNDKLQDRIKSNHLLDAHKDLVKLACKHNNINALTTLIHAGANLSDLDKFIALNFAIRTDNPALTKELTTLWGEPEVMRVIFSMLNQELRKIYLKKYDIKDLLTRGTDENQIWREKLEIIRNGFYISPICFAAASNEIDLIRKLIIDGVNLNETDTFYLAGAAHGPHTPLSTALIYNNIEIAKILIEAGADLNWQNYLGESALSIAAENKQLEIVKLLLNANVHIDQLAQKNIVDWYNQAFNDGELETAKYLAQFLSTKEFVTSTCSIS